LTSPFDCQKALQILAEGIAAGARASALAKLTGVGLITLQRWRRQLAGNNDGIDLHKASSRRVAKRLSAEECQRILLTCNEPKYASLPPGQIVPDLADQGIYMGSEHSFYRVLYAHGQLHRRGKAHLPQEARPVHRLRADGPNQVWSWDISNLPNSAKGIGHYLYQVIDIWGRKVVAWDVEQTESAEVAAELVSRMPKRADKQEAHSAIDPPCAGTGTSIHGATLEVRLEELGVLRSFSKPRVSNDNRYSE
jgi:transposase InsO family protein